MIPSFTLHRILSYLVLPILLVSCTREPSTPTEEVIKVIETPTAVPVTRQETLTPSPTTSPTETAVPSPTPTQWPTELITSDSDRSSKLIIWRINDAFPLHRINSPLIGSSQPMFTTFAVSPDGKLIASGDDFGGIRFWSMQSGEELTSFDINAWPLDLAFTPDGAGLVVVLADGTVRLFGTSKP